MGKRSFYATIGKRWVDVMISVVLLFLFAIPILLIFFCFVFLGWSPLFFQQRVGRNGKVFRLVKFRTLDPDAGRPLLERKFAFGSFLRRSNLDELPQLFNILKGEMSIIGPRPLPVEYLSLYSEEQYQRHMVRPGITGWAQVNGRHSISWQKKFDFDLYYVQNLSLTLDSLIIFRTIILILSFKRDLSLLEKKFTGNKNDE